MHVITTTDELAECCADYSRQPWITIDTEFIRERTYWSQLCLVQMAHGGGGDWEAVIIDPLSNGIDLAPLYELMAEESTVKVFHAARQDVEIFYKLAGAVPTPLFDTQVAAMVCGYGEQVGYETLVRKIVKAELDKSSRFTDWSRRPLSEKQLTYALGDVTHLRLIYEELSTQLEKSGRAHWVREEMAILTAAETYESPPEEAWTRIKTRSSNPRFLAIVRSLAAWREATAQGRDVPRNRVLKDDALMEIAAARPSSVEELSKLRLLQREARKPETAAEILAAVAAGIACPEDLLPRPPEPPRRSPGSGAVADLMKVLLKARCDELGVASKLIASASDLEALAGEENPDVPVLKGWRREAFGEDALRLKRGEVALSAGRRGVKIHRLAEAAE